MTQIYSSHILKIRIIPNIYVFCYIYKSMKLNDEMLNLVK